MSSIIIQVGGQYRYLWYLWDIISQKLHHSRQYSPVLPAAIVTAELFKYGSIKCKQTQKNFRKIYHTLSNSVFIFWLPKTWIHYSEDITGRWRDEDIAVSSFSLCHTWLNNIILHSKGGCIAFYVRQILYPIPSYLKVLWSINRGNNPYNNCFFWAMPSNIDLHQVLPLQARAILWCWSIFSGITLRNIYHRVNKISISKLLILIILINNKIGDFEC